MADMTGITLRCYCNDEHGRRLGTKCEQLKAAIARGGNTPRHGVYQVRISTGINPVTGKRNFVKRGGIPTRDEALDIRDDIAGKVRRKTYRFEAVTLAEYIEGWFERSELKATTLRDYRRYADNDIKPRLGAYKLTELRKSHVAHWIDELVDEGRGRTAVRRAHATLRSILNDALERDLIDANPAARVKLPSVTPAKVRPWEPEEAGRFLDAAAEHRIGALFELAIMTGMRRGELVGLRWSDIDLERAELVVNVQRVRVGKEVVEQTAKTEAGQGRIVPLSERAVGALLAWQVQQGGERDVWEALGHQWIDNDRVFTMHDGRPLRPEYPARIFDDIVQATKLRRQRFHDLRHLFASLMLSNGQDLGVVSKVMGHANSQITRDLYAHLVGNAARAAVEGGLELLPDRVTGSR